MRKTKFLALLLLTLMLVTCKQNEPEETQPTALFSYAQNDLKINYTNASQNAQSYSWSFGDGQYSTEENPVHTYSSEGTYKVTLTAYNGSKKDSTSQNVTLIEQAPKASFTSEIQQPRKVILTNNSSNATSFEWDFGDGYKSTEKSPTHKYYNKGVYKITLIAKNKNKSDVYSSNVTILEPTKIFITGFVFHEIAPNEYYKIKLTHKTTFSTKTDINTTWNLLSSANTPYTYTLQTPFQLKEDIYYLAMYQNYQSSGDGELYSDTHKIMTDLILWAGDESEVYETTDPFEVNYYKIEILYKYE